MNKKQIVLALGLVTCVVAPVSGYRLNNRWSNTASGSTGSAGTSAVLTWGFANDGSNINGLGSSGLISWLDTVYGPGPGGADLTQRPWFRLFDESFGRWGEVVGVEYIYEPNDDSVTVGSAPGVLGVRADMRIAGAFIDGPSNTLAFNNFPNNGDMVIDTGDSGFYSVAVQDFRRMRNVLMHEHGHGGGLNHVESVTARFLMEPTINATFDGPQLDDIRGMQAHYGDFYEKSNGGAGNNTAANATSLGLIPVGQSISLGRDGGTTLIQPTQTDFLSINVASDVDYFSFTVDGPARLDAVLTPQGTTYREGAQGGAQADLNSAAVSDLSLEIISSDGVSQLATANLTGLGEVESLAGVNLPAAGEYFARVTGSTNFTQLYQIDLA
ncbi:MAG: matrixin family metalloprotease, partial [Planctomycetota bacterium]